MSHFVNQSQKSGISIHHLSGGKIDFVVVFERAEIQRYRDRARCPVRLANCGGNTDGAAHDTSSQLATFHISDEVFRLQGAQYLQTCSQTLMQVLSDVFVGRTEPHPGTRLGCMIPTPQLRKALLDNVVDSHVTQPHRQCRKLLVCHVGANVFGNFGLWRMLDNFIHLLLARELKIARADRQKMPWLKHFGNEFDQAAIPIITRRSTLQGRFDGLGTRAMTNADIAFQSHLCDVPSTVWTPCLSNDADAVAAFAIDTTADECHLMLIDLA